MARGVDALVGLRPARPEHDLARGVSLLDRASNVVDDAQDFGRMAIMLDEREGIFFGAGIDVHVIERGNDGIQQANRMQIDQGQAVEIERLIGTRHRRRGPALVLHGKILLGGLFGNLIDRSRLMQHAEKGVGVGQNGRIGRHVRVAPIFEAEPKHRALRERRYPRWPGPRGSIRLARVLSRGRARLAD